MLTRGGATRVRRAGLALAIAGASLLLSLGLARTARPPGIFLKYVDAVNHPDPSRYQDLSPLYLSLARTVLPRAGIRGLRLFHAILLALACAAGALTVELSSGPTAGMAAGILLVSYRPFLVYAGVLEPETLIVALLAAALHAAHRSRREGNGGRSASRWAAVASLFLGLAAMARPQYVILVPLWALWVLRPAGEVGRWRPTLAALSAGAILLLPFAAHRLLRYGSLSVMNPGPVFYEGNGPQSSTGIYTPPHIVERLAATYASGADMAHVAYRRVASAETGQAATPSVANRYWAGLALDGIRRRPWRAAQRFVSKAALALAPYELHDLINADDLDRRLRRKLPWGFGLVLTLACLALLRNPGSILRHLPALSIAGLSWAVQVLFYPSARQRLPMALGLCVAGVALLASAPRRRRGLATASIAALALVGALTYFGAPVACLEEAKARTALGVLGPSAGESLAAFLDGRAWRPQIWEAARAVALARDAFERGRPVPAIAPLAVALRRASGPDWLRARAAWLAARSSLVSGQTGTARSLVRQCVALDSDFGPGRALLTALDATSCPAGLDRQALVPGEDPMNAQLLLAQAAASVQGPSCAARVAHTVLKAFPALAGAQAATTKPIG